MSVDFTVASYIQEHSKDNEIKDFRSLHYKKIIQLACYRKLKT